MLSRLGFGLFGLVVALLTAGCPEETASEARARPVAPAMERWAAPKTCAELCQQAIRCKVKDWKDPSTCERECNAAASDAGNEDLLELYKCLWNGMSCWTMKACAGAKPASSAPDGATPHRATPAEPPATSPPTKAP
jgi:hypothetical protein